jgi:hypothetical protein
VPWLWLWRVSWRWLAENDAIMIEDEIISEADASGNVG